jgi:hypothetical protein
VAPEFEEFLLAVPEEERRGRVFNLRGVERTLPQGGGRKPVECVTDPDWVSRVVCRIGKRAKVVVDRKTKRDPKTGKVREVVKFASAHDLRRSFGTRWALRVVTKVLKELMRHRSIATTEKYYVDLDAQTVAGELWAAYERSTGNSRGNTRSNDRPTENQEKTKALEEQGLA